MPNERHPMSYAEIAVELDMDPTEVEETCELALLKLRAALKLLGIDRNDALEFFATQARRAGPPPQIHHTVPSPTGDD